MASPPINASPEDPSGTWGLLDLIQGSQSLENIDTIVLSSAMSTLVRLCKSVPLWLTVGALIASIQLLICSVLIAKQNKKVSRRHSLFSSGGLVLLSLASLFHLASSSLRTPFLLRPTEMYRMFTPAHLEEFTIFLLNLANSGLLIAIASVDGTVSRLRGNSSERAALVTRVVVYVFAGILSVLSLLRWSLTTHSLLNPTTSVLDATEPKPEDHVYHMAILMTIKTLTTVAALVFFVKTAISTVKPGGDRAATKVTRALLAIVIVWLVKSCYEVINYAFFMLPRGSTTQAAEIASGRDVIRDYPYTIEPITSLWSLVIPFGLLVYLSKKGMDASRSIVPGAVPGKDNIVETA